ncbi:hypothetical protein ZIOFF_062764 [Zingiber officinale]|uniref:Retrotransposon gag domain-containing protein n=1 Tax=Zingiber officinale TaxID=94328 RepID=A0A8J5F1J6_ZINOF|nr:hypothetical protein ZIOFF_062764 [Zingiber officinale]
MRLHGHKRESPNLRITRYPTVQPSVSSRAVNLSAVLLLRLWKLRATLDLEADRHREEQIGQGKTRTRSGSRGGLREDWEACFDWFSSEMPRFVSLVDASVCFLSLPWGRMAFGILRRSNLLFEVVDVESGSWIVLVRWIVGGFDPYIVARNFLLTSVRNLLILDLEFGRLWRTHDAYISGEDVSPGTTEGLQTEYARRRDGRMTLNDEFYVDEIIFFWDWYYVISDMAGRRNNNNGELGGQNNQFLEGLTALLHEQNRIHGEQIQQILQAREQGSTPRRSTPSTQPVYKQFRELGPTEFKGTTHPIAAEGWIRSLETIFDFMQHTDANKVRCAIFMLQDDARAREFLELRQGDMTVAEYVRRFERGRYFVPMITSQPVEELKYFTEGLRPAIRHDVRLSWVTTFREAVDEALMSERDRNDMVMEAQNKRLSYQGRDQQEPGKKRSFPGQNPGKQSFKQAQLRQQIQKTQAAEGTGVRAENKVRCSKCEKIHAGQCLTGTDACYICKKSGHFAREFPLLKEPTKGRVFAMTQEQVDLDTAIITGMIYIANIPPRVLIDSGATHSFISEAYLTKLGIIPERMVAEYSVSLPSGEELHSNRMIKNCQMMMQDHMVVAPREQLKLSALIVKSNLLDQIREGQMVDQQLTEWKRKDEEKGQAIYSTVGGVVRYKDRIWVPKTGIKSLNLHITRYPTIQPSVSSRAVNLSAELLLRLWKLRAMLDLEADRLREEQIGQGKMRMRSGSRGGLGEDGEAQEQANASICFLSIPWGRMAFGILRRSNLLFEVVDVVSSL